MPKLKISYAFDDLLLITIALILILYTRSLIILVLISLYLLYRTNYKSIIILYFLLLLIIIRIFINYIPINYYYIKQVTTNKIIASNIIKDLVIYDDIDISIDTIIKVNGDNKINKNISSLKNNIIHTSDANIEIINELPTIRHFLHERYRQLDNDNIKELIGKLLFNDINYESDNQIIQEISLSYLVLFKFILYLLSKIKHKNSFSYIIASFIFIFFLGFDYNTLRIITIEFLYFKCTRKELALSLAIIIMVLYNPFSIFSYAFIIPFLIRFIFIFKTIINFKSIIMIIQSFFFNEINLFSIMFYRYYMILMVIAILLSILVLFIPEISIFLKLLYNILENLYILISFTIRGKLSIIVIIFYICIIRLYKINSNYLQKILLLLLVLSNISNIFSSISFIDIGQGDAILIKSAFNKENILIDTGPNFTYYKLDRYLKGMGIYDIDYLIITHKDKDHSGNIRDLYQDYNIKNTIIEHIDINTNYFKLKSLNENIADNPNDNSLVYHMHHEGYNFLFTGDISKDIESRIINKNPELDIDFLKLSHHGSKTGTSQRLLRNNNIKLAIASTSGMYNHPSKEVIELLSINDIPLYTTKDKGDITMIFSKVLDFIKFNDGEFVIIK